VTLGQLRQALEALVDDGTDLDTPVHTEGCDCIGDVHVVERGTGGGAILLRRATIVRYQ
jgi:hypothetical protein